MQVKIEKIIKLQTIYEKIKGLSLPIQTTYKFSKLFEEVKKGTEFYYTQINLIIEEYGERDSEGNLIKLDSSSVQISTDRLQEAQDKINELLDCEVDVLVSPFSLEELEPINLSVEEFSYLLPFIKE